MQQINHAQSLSPRSQVYHNHTSYSHCCPSQKSARASRCCSLGCSGLCTSQEGNSSSTSPTTCNGSHSASRPHRIVSQVGKDRANMRRKRRNRPGWTKPTRAPGDSGGGARPRKKTEKNMGAQMKLNNWTVGNEATFENVDDGQKENQGGRRKRAQGQGSGGMFPPLM